MRCKLLNVYKTGADGAGATIAENLSIIVGGSRPPADSLNHSERE